MTVGYHNIKAITIFYYVSAMMIVLLVSKIHKESKLKYRKACAYILVVVKCLYSNPRISSHRHSNSPLFSGPAG
jgi:hypothetical protein